MRIYTVHLRPGEPAPERAVVLVKEGFCWPALFFSVLWALWHRLWWAAAAFLLLALALEAALALSGADAVASAAAGLGLAVLIGASANDLRRARLARAGWRAAGITAAASEEAAVRRFIDLHPDMLGPVQYRRGGFAAP